MVAAAPLCLPMRDLRVGMVFTSRDTHIPVSIPIYLSSNHHIGVDIQPTTWYNVRKTSPFLPLLNLGELPQWLNQRNYQQPRSLKLSLPYPLSTTCKLRYLV